MVLEYSGRYLAMIELAASLKLVVYGSLIACIFFPSGMTVGQASLLQDGVGIASYIGKLAVLGVVLAVFETVIAKMRVFRVPNFLGIALMLSLLGTLLLFVSRSL
jgi:formate hydrogenlyase subunit 4